MTRLRDKLLEDYYSQYSRVNAEVDPRRVSPKVHKYYDATLSDLLLNVPQSGIVADIGCGSGTLVHWLSKKTGVKLIGIDISQSQIEAARRFLPEGEFHCESGLEFLKRSPGSLSAVFCMDVLEHIQSDDEMLDLVIAAKESLKPGGFVVCRVPNASNLLGCHSRYIDLTHARSFTTTSALQLLSAAGLTNCRIVPIRSGHFLGALRLFSEYLLHRAIYRICGSGLERCFSSNLCMVGFCGK